MIVCAFGVHPGHALSGPAGERAIDSSSFLERLLRAVPRGSKEKRLLDAMLLAVPR